MYVFNILVLIWFLMVLMVAYSILKKKLVIAKRNPSAHWIIFRDSTGFSKDICGILLLANIARCFFWIGRQFEIGPSCSVKVLGACAFTLSWSRYKPCWFKPSSCLSRSSHFSTYASGIGQQRVQNLWGCRPESRVSGNGPLIVNISNSWQLTCK